VSSLGRGSGLGGLAALLGLALIFSKKRAPELNGNGTVNGAPYRTYEDPEQEETAGEDQVITIPPRIITKYLTTPPVIIREFVPDIPPYTPTPKGVATIEQEIRNVVAYGLAREGGGGGVGDRPLFT